MDPSDVPGYTFPIRSKPRHLNPKTAEYLPVGMVTPGDVIELPYNDLPKKVYRVENGERLQEEDGSHWHIPTTTVHVNGRHVVAHTHDAETSMWMRRKEAGHRTVK